MKKIAIKNASIIILICLFTIQSLKLQAAPLPVLLPLEQLIYMQDPYWIEDVKQANANINHFMEPLDTVNYTDYRYVGSHNAFTDPHFFKIARQQDQPVLGQLTYGVRGLMFDTYDWNQGWPFALVGPRGTAVCLSHDAPGFVALVQKGTYQYQSLKYELRRVVEFLRVNPKAVVTIILENYANTLISTRAIEDVMMIEAKYNVLLRPSDLIANQWPTLGWMRANNKRLVIFTQKGSDTQSTFRQFSYMVENKYDTIDEVELCTLRPESSGNKSLVAFNNFKSIGITAPVLLTKEAVEYETAQRITTNCQAKNFANGRLFNGYWVDRIIDSCNYLYANGEETIFEYVNDLNANPNKTMP